VAGKRLGPAEIEEVLLELPGITEAAAIGVDDPAKGQLLVVFIVTTGTVDEQSLSSTISRHVETRLGKLYRPGRIHLVRQLPKTRNGKVMRRAIRSAYCGLPPATCHRWTIGRRSKALPSTPTPRPPPWREELK
jgi:acetyl-CoA synthetase